MKMVVLSCACRGISAVGWWYHSRWQTVRISSASRYTQSQHFLL